MNNSIKNFLNLHTGLLIRIDDIAENMNWSLMNKCEVLFDQHNIKPLLGEKRMGNFNAWFLSCLRSRNK